ncbi:MAG: hypothetical protein NVV83_22030 [Afipia sp.]|nr:hypothetical protein [Afipia sp.]
MPEEPKNSLPALGPRIPDRFAALLRSATGVVPFIGAAIAEVVTELVPNQRADRIEKYLLYLVDEIEALKLKAPSEQLKTPESIDLIEDGAYQAARALSDERKRYIAHAVAQGIAAEDREKLSEKRILGLIGELDDEEMLILDAFGTDDIPQQGLKFKQLIPPAATINAPREVIDRAALYKAALVKLERLSLVDNRVKLDNKTKLPEFDTFTGEPKGRRQISSLGRLVLRRAGLLQSKL